MEFNKIVDNKITEVKDKKGTRCYLCRIKKIEGFERLTQLAFLNLDSNQLDSFKGFSKITSLTNLYLI
jgi:Leucine-rich repeat (LRR) protein